MLWNSQFSPRSAGARAFPKRIAQASLLLLLLTITFPGASCGRGPEKSAAADKPVAEAAPPSPEQPPEAPPPPPEPAPVRIPGGTALSVRLLESISSSTARPGQTFAAELAAPLILQGDVILPKSSRVRGRVVSARPSGRLHKPGYLRLTLDALQMPDGTWVNLRTTSVSASGKSHEKRNLTFIGGIAGLGAAIGGIAGGGKGAAIGAASGAGTGTAAAYATGKEEVTFPAERKLRFRTVEEVVMSR